MFVALVLLICDRESEELYYKERDVEKSDELEDDSSSDARWVMEFLKFPNFFGGENLWVRI
jgi:hypothetical protein